MAQQNEPNARKIITGAAAIFISNESSLSATWNNPTTGAKIPTGVTGQSLRTQFNDSASGWRNLGYTSGGVEFTYTPTYNDVTVDQLLDAALLFKTKVTASAKTTLSEATLENLMVSWAQDPFGGDGQPATYHGNGSTIGGVAQSDTAGFPVAPDGSGAGLALNPGDEQLGINAGSLGIEPLERQMAFVGSSTRTSSNLKRERVYHLRRSLNVAATTHSLKRDAETTFPVEFRLLPSNVSGAEYGTVTDRVISF